MSFERYENTKSAIAGVMFVGFGFYALAGCSVSGYRSLTEYQSSIGNQVAKDGFPNYVGQLSTSDYPDSADFGDCQIQFKSINVVDNPKPTGAQAIGAAEFFDGRTAVDVNNYDVIIPGQALDMTHTVQNAAELQQYVQANNIVSLASCIPNTIVAPSTGS
jgi:hypothetical protein